MNAGDGSRGNTQSRAALAVMPRSPSEALSPTRPPTRPRAKRGRREARRLSPGLRVVNGLLTVAVIALGLGFTVIHGISEEVGRDGPSKEIKTLAVRKGDGARDIAHRLEQDGIISSEHVFVSYYVGRALASWFGQKPLQLKAGEYEFPAGASIRSVAEIIGEGRSMLYRLSVPEGLTSWQIVERLKADTSLAGEIAAVPAEGTLLPETYKVQRSTLRQAVLEMMQVEQRKLIDMLWTARQPDLPFKTVEEALTLASIVERETGRNDKHADIASVFVNRLRKGMPLQSDPTILYGLGGGQVVWGRPIQKSEIMSKTAHNTYVIKGLPPSPICNPSRKSIEAVLNPTQSNYLYFVASGNGSSVFSQTIEEHNAAVTNWRKVEQGIRAKQAEAARAAATAAAAAAAAGAQAPAAQPPAATDVAPQPTGTGTLDAAAPATQPSATAPASAVPAQPAAVQTLVPAPANVPLPVRKPKK